MRKMTEQNLRAAFAGESQAHMRYGIFSEKAARENRKNLARLFKAIAFAEEVHATNHYRALGEINNSSRNLQVAIDGETYEVEDMYPAYRAIAELQQERAAVNSTGYALEAEKVHEEMYKKAKQAIDQGSDIQVGDIYICDVCGYTVEGEAPDVCPICGAKRERYRKF